VNRSEGTSEYVLVFDDDADRDELEQTLLEGEQIGVRPPPLPNRLVNLEDGSEVLRALMAFFAGLGVVGLLHALVSSVRRRQRLFAVWRALGFTPGQVRRAVLWQGQVITFIGVAVGLPVGIVVGRLTWLAVIGDLGVIDDPTTPVLLVLAVIPIALVAALVIGAWPAWSAGRGHAAADLHDE
jgi:ABC-type lipoprotein release transport system permease subunit